LGTTATYTESKVTKRDELFIDSYQNGAVNLFDAIFGLAAMGFLWIKTISIRIPGNCSAN
jgi:hypothetical protein